MWYRVSGGQSVDNGGNQLLGALLPLLAGGVPGLSGGHLTAAQTGSGGSFFSGAVSSFLGNQPAVSNVPQAGVYWMLLDEQFGWQVGNGSGSEPVGSSEQYKQYVRDCSNPIQVQQSGYIYVYTANQSNIDVYFDNLQVSHLHSALLEETHYYPFGLTMAGISSKAANGLKNNKKYDSYELNDDFDINWYESFYRTHDPQSGRFLQIDPKIEALEMLSPFSAMGNNPISNNDPLGDITHYYNSSGNLLYSQDDKNDYATLNVIADKNLAAFNQLAGILSEVQELTKGTKLEGIINKLSTGLLRKLGISYDTKEYEAYFNKHAKDEYKGTLFTPTDGKGPLMRERMAGLDEVDGFLRVLDNTKEEAGNNPIVSSTSDGGVADIHTHVTEGRTMNTHKGPAHVESGKAPFGDRYSGDLWRGHPSPGGQTFRYTPVDGYFNVVVSPTHIYLYKYGSVTIAIDRKGVPSKNPGEIK